MAGESPLVYPPEWSTVRLGDIALKIGSGATPRGGEESYLPKRSTFALVRSQNVFDRRFDTTGLVYISEEQAERLKSVVLQPGDLLLNITGDGITFARSCVIPGEILPACVNQHVAIIRVDRNVADPGYILSYLTHPAVKRYIESFNAGGSRRAITKGNIESFLVPLPPLYEQRAIALILGSLDKKIELNRADERDAGSDSAGALQIVVRGFRPRPGQIRRPQPRAAEAPQRLIPGFIPRLGAGRNPTRLGGARP